ncbi:hypothetical protein RhiJN_00870 [Ceratobasidium sp. AG-Ba]|nr:hypothetical protein RhiJN_00870 [Ceratobasidium sp. AG-Ba]
MSATGMSDDRVGDESNANAQGDDGKELPTYQALAAREGGPNSRFGRWQAWVEKRAAERYADDPQRSRQNSGWGPTVDTPEAPQPPAYSAPPEQIRVQTPAPPPVTRAIARCLSVAHFGSRFIPHSHTPIEALLPLGLDDRFILLGTQRGLAVLDILPSLHGAQSTPATARVLEAATPHDVWTGEGVWQLAMLETQDTGGSSPQGTVLALVGAEVNEHTVDRKGMEPTRTIRMYNLASLTSLVKWCVTRKDAHPIDLRRPAGPNPTQPSATLKKHRPASSSVFSSFKAMFIDSQSPSPHIQPYDLSTAASPVTGSAQPINSVQNPPGGRNGSVAARPTPSTRLTSDTPGDWDIIDDLPLRWATDYVSLSKPGTKLAGLSVLFFELWHDSSIGTAGQRTYLAVATRQCIFLYESAPGERAFRIVKEFYTPLPARSVRFVQQLSSPTDAGFTTVSRSFSALSSRTSPTQTHGHHHHHRNASHSQTQRTRRTSLTDSSRGQPQLALFVTFAKKAGLIRLGDAAVGEVELWDEDYNTAGSIGPGSARRSVESLSNAGFGVEREKGTWAPLETCEIPLKTTPEEPYDGQTPLAGGPVSPYPASSISSPISANPSTATWSTAPSAYPLLNPGLPNPHINTNTNKSSPSRSPGPLTAPPRSAPSPPMPLSAFVAGPSYPSQVALLTRGRRTDVVALPLRTPVGSRPPLCTILWMTPPTKVAPRVVIPAPNSHGPNEPSETQSGYLQVVAFLKEGVDVAEIPFSALRLDKPVPWGKGKGKGKANTGPTEEVRLVKVDVGGPAGYLAPGGRWHLFGNGDAETDNGGTGTRPGTQEGRIAVQRANSAWSVSSWDSSMQEHQREKERRRKAEEGCYAWVCRGHGVRVYFF